jgi:hypothetical protein
VLARSAFESLRDFGADAAAPAGGLEGRGDHLRGRSIAGTPSCASDSPLRRFTCPCISRQWREPDMCVSRRYSPEPQRQRWSNALISRPEGRWVQRYQILAPTGKFHPGPLTVRCLRGRGDGPCMKCRCASYPAGAGRAGAGRGLQAGEDGLAGGGGAAGAPRSVRFGFDVVMREASRMGRVSRSSPPDRLGAWDARAQR